MAVFGTCSCINSQGESSSGLCLSNSDNGSGVIGVLFGFIYSAAFIGIIVALFNSKSILLIKFLDNLQ